jgi:FkbM family methyltransferase
MPPLPRILHLNWLRYSAAVRTLPELSDAASRLRFMRHVMRNCSFRRLSLPTHSNEPWIPLRVKALGGRTIYCRSGLSDLGVVYDTFVGQYHLPPADLRPLNTILDLGSNIGLTMAHYAARYTHTRIRGVELDKQNCELARRNVEVFGKRCQVAHAAVWHEEGKVSYGGVRESGYAILAMEGAKPKTTVQAVTIASLIDQLEVPAVDFVKMDIEGAEKEVLRKAEPWIRRVRCLKVEVHPEKASTSYTPGMCIKDLEKHGMICSLDLRHHSCVIARREEAG